MKNPNVYLISNASTDIYNNILSDFTNVLPKPIEFPFYEEWQVSIKEISMSHHFVVEKTPQFVYIICDILDGQYNQEQILGIYAYSVKIGRYLERKSIIFTINFSLTTRKTRPTKQQASRSRHTCRTRAAHSWSVEKDFFFSFFSLV